MWCKWMWEICVRSCVLLGWDKRYYGVYDAGASWAGDQVHAGVLDFFLQELVELPTQLLHQLSNLYGPKKNPNTDSRWSVPFFPLCFVYSWSECITHTDTNSDNELLLHVRRQWIESSHHPERWWTHHVVGPHWPAPHRIAPLDTHIPYCNLG